MHFPPLLAVISLFALALAEVNLGELVTKLPPCTLACSARLLAAAQCQLPDIRNCLCTNTTLQNEVFVCVYGSCNITEQAVSSVVSQSICEGVPQESRSAEIIRIVIIISAFTFPIIALRLFSRYTLTKIAMDDWIVVVVAICLVPMTAIPIINAKKGFGTHAWDVPVQNVKLLRQLYYISQIFYVIVQNLAKISILLLYLRIFPDRRFRIATKIAITWIALRASAYLLVVTIQCIPINALWDLTVHGKCVSATGITYSGAALSIFEDLVIILMPIPPLKALNLSLRKRISLIFMFALGSFACITSMVRLKFIANYTLNSLDATWDNIDVIIWSIIEVYTAMICACLMSIRPLLVRWFPSIFPTTTGSNSNQYDQNQRRTRGSKYWHASPSNNGAVELASKENVSRSTEEDAESGKGKKDQIIKVTREFTVGESHYESQGTSVVSVELVTRDSS